MDARSGKFPQPSTSGKLATTNITNRILAAVKDQMPMLGTGSVDGKGRGTPLVGIIWDAGPNGEDDTTDHTYWVRRATAYSDGSYSLHGKAKLREIGHTAASSTYAWCVATNLGERPAKYGGATETAGSHTLPKGTAVLYWPTIDAGGVVRFVFRADVSFLIGTITEVPDCGSFVMAEIPPDETTEYKVHLIWPQVVDVRKHMAVDDQIPFFVIPGTSLPIEGIAIGQDIGGVELMDDGVALTETGKLSHLDIINKQGTGNREDFDLQRLELSVEDDCAFDWVQLEWNGIDVEGYSGDSVTATGMRRIEFAGGAYTPVLTACVDFKVEEDADGITAKVSGRVPLPVVAKVGVGSSANPWLEMTPNADTEGACQTASPELNHIGPDTEGVGGSITTIDMLSTIEDSGSAFVVRAYRLLRDFTGHIIGVDLESYTEKSITYVEKEVVTDVNCVEGVIVPTKETIKVVTGVS